MADFWPLRRLGKTARVGTGRFAETVYTFRSGELARMKVGKSSRMRWVSAFKARSSTMVRSVGLVCQQATR